MRRSFILVCLVVMGVAATPPVDAAESYVCWYQPAPSNGVGDASLVCRIDGALVIEFPTVPPIVTVPDIGFDVTGPCWYRRSGGWSGWVLATVYPNLDARLWWSPSGDPAGPFLGDATYRACVTEPSPTPPPITAVWEFIERYPFAVPRPAVSPPGRGIVGVPVYVDVDPPRPVTSTIASPLGGSIDVEIKVETVTIVWGDGSRSSFGPDTWHLLGGHPEGAALHAYEESAPRDLEVSFDWGARWRISGGSWQPVAVPATRAVVGYPVDEVVGRRIG